MLQTSDLADSRVVYLQGRAFLRDGTGGLRPVFAGGDGTEDPDTGDGTGTGNKSGNEEEAEGEENEEEDESGKDEKKFSQKEVDAIVAKQKAKASRGKVKPEDFGFKTAKEMQEFIEGQKKKADEDKSEADKKLEQAIEDAKNEAKEEVTNKANQRLIKAEFKLAAIRHGIKEEALEDAFVLAQRLDDWEVEVDEDKDVVTGLTKEFFDTLKKQKPFLVAEKEGKGKRGDAGAGARGDKGGDGAGLEDTYSALKNVR